MGEVIMDGLGSGNTWQIDETHAGLIVGSVAITNASIDVEVTVADYIKVTPSGAFYNTVTQSGAFLLTNGSVWQGTNPWVILGSVTTTSKPISYDSNEQLTFIAGSPSAETSIFTGGVVKTLVVKCDEDTYLNFSGIANPNSFLAYAGESISADFEVGSISHLYKSNVGSIWVWGGR